MTLMTNDKVAGDILRLKNLLSTLQDFATKEMGKILGFQHENYNAIAGAETSELYVEAPHGADVKGFYLIGGEVRVIYTTHGFGGKGEYDMALTSIMAADHIACLQQKLDEATEQRLRSKEQRAAELEILERQQLAALKENYPDV